MRFPAPPPRRPSRAGRGFGTERDPARVVFFSDAVVAIAVTLLVLEIRPPQDTRHLLHGLVALWPSYLAYAITFLLIGQVWATAWRSDWQPSCSTSSGTMRATISGCSAPLSIRRGRDPSAGASGSPLPGRHRNPAGRPGPRALHGRDRRVHPLLLAADPWRDRRRQTSARRRRLVRGSARERRSRARGSSRRRTVARPTLSRRSTRMSVDAQSAAWEES
jgi:hypothetical protein